MKAILYGGVAATALLLVSVQSAQAQSRGERRQAAQAAATVSTSNPSVTITELHIRRDAVQDVARQLSAGRSRDRGLMGSLRRTITGDKQEIEAAERVLAQMAQSLTPDGSSTVVVVIGGEDDRDKVVESLSIVQRPVTVAWVDRDFEDAVSDNTVLGAGIAGTVTDAATNLWVFLPRFGSAPREEPDHTLSTAVASETLWNGLFAADGDAVDVQQLQSLADSGDDTAPESQAAPPASDGSAAAPAPGDVVVPRIASVRILAAASTDAEVVGTAAASDEFVVTGPAKDGFLPVEGTTLRGWVSQALVIRRSPHAPR